MSPNILRPYGKRLAGSSKKKLGGQMLSKSWDAIEHQFKSGSPKEAVVRALVQGLPAARKHCFYWLILVVVFWLKNMNSRLRERAAGTGA